MSKSSLISPVRTKNENISSNKKTTNDWVLRFIAAINHSDVSQTTEQPRQSLPLHQLSN